MSQFLAILSNPSVISVVALILAELKVRFTATEKPMSIVHLVADGMKAVANFLDAVLPQNLSAPAQPAAPAPAQPAA